MAVLIDTSVIINAERRGHPPSEAFALSAAEEPALSAVTASELLIGVHRADSPGRRARREAFVEAILGGVPVIAFDLPIARVYARLAAELAAAGQSIGAHDLMIAATALSEDAAVLTVNVRDFARVPGLSVRTPSPNQ